MTTNARFCLRRILELLPQYGYTLSDEIKLQDGIADVLSTNEMQFQREVTLGSDRFDFLCEGGVVIEAKVAGTYSEALRQAERYCQHEEVSAVVIASTRSWRVGRADGVLHGRPVHVVPLRGRLT